MATSEDMERFHEIRVEYERIEEGNVLKDTNIEYSVTFKGERM